MTRGLTDGTQPGTSGDAEMLTAIAEFAVRRRRTVLVAALGLFVVSGVFGADVQQHLSQGGFEDPQAESTRAATLLDDHFDTGPPNIVLLVEAERGDIDAPDVAEAGAALTRELAREPMIAEAVSYWTLARPPPLRSASGDTALVLGRITGDRDEVIEHMDELSPKYARRSGPVDVRVGGMAEVIRETGKTIEEDMARAEAIALPLTLLVLILVFGSVVSASLPVAIGALAIVGTFLILRVVASVTEVSVYSLSATTAMGLALAIDYSLFVVSRYREELRRGLMTREAVVRTMQTAGRTVAFGGLTVAISLAVLAIFPLAFLRSFAYAGVAVVAFAVFGAIVVLPAALAALGPRVDTFSWRRDRHAPEHGGAFWHRAALLVMRRPVLVGGGVIAVLLLLGAPFLSARFGLPDDRVLPPHSKVRAVHDELRTEFRSQEAGALSVVAVGIGDPISRGPEVVDYAERLSNLEGVGRVDSAFGVFVGGDQVRPASPLLTERFSRPDGTWLSVVPSVEPISAEAEALLKNIRDADSPFPVLVAGSSAELVDSKAALFGRMPLAAGIIALISFTCLFLMFGSVLVPAKAIVLNVLSLTATFGAMVWIFQDGNLSNVLEFTPTGFLTTTIPILMFCVAFGLSMDYEVFLLSRIKEEHDHGADNVASVAAGLERTGRIVTAAAALMAMVFLAFATSGISFIKLFGIGLATAVLMDATLIRAALVPSFMRLAGDANWWAPAPLRRLYERWGIHELPEERAVTGPRDESAREMSTVVTFHAHPDDEAILTGGTIARLTAEGHRVVLVVATRGELGEVPDGLLAPGQDLAHRRAAETRWAAEILGIGRVEFLGYHDSGMAGSPTALAPGAFCRVDVDEAAERLAAIVREEGAEVLVVYDDHGGYGHPDHVQVHRVGMRAAEIVPDVALYEATINRDHVRRGRQRLAEGGFGDAAVDVPEFGPDFGEPESAITHAVDVRAYAAVKRRAMAAHSSQISDTSFFLALPPPAFAAGFGFEWYIRAGPTSSTRPTVLDELADGAAGTPTT